MARKSSRSESNRKVRVRDKHVATALARADWKKIDGMRDRDVQRAIKNDAQTSELDPHRPIEIVLASGAT